MQQIQENEKIVKLENYIIQKTIGQGGFGKVKLATHSLTNINVAIKIMNKKRLRNQNLYQKTKREIQYLRHLDHPNIIKLVEVLESRENIYVIMEYLEKGNLYELISEKERLSEREAHHYFCQIIQAVEYCHSSLISHRDIKLENILLNDRNIVKLADFGLSNIMKDGKYLNTSCGSPHYAAPEVIDDKPYCGTCIDCWSCGVILFTLISGYLPFDEEIYQKLFKKIREADYQIPNHFSQSLKDLISSIFRTDPSTRIAFSTIKYHPWVSQYVPTSDSFLFQQQYNDQYIIRFTQRLLNQIEINEEIIDSLRQINPQFQNLNSEIVKRAFRPNRNKDEENIQSSYNLVATSLYKQKSMNMMNQQTLLFNDVNDEIHQQQNEQFIRPEHRMQTQDNNQWQYGMVLSQEPLQIMNAMTSVLTCMNSFITAKSKNYQINCYYKCNKIKISNDRMFYSNVYTQSLKQVDQVDTKSKYTQNIILFTIKLYKVQQQGILVNTQLTKGNPIIFLEYMNRFTYLLNKQFLV